MEIVNERIKTNLSTSDFFYELPPELIAQTPAEKRDESRLFVLDRKEGSFTHRRFYDVFEYLKAGDVLVVNSSKVIPARLLGVTEKTGSSMELLLLKMHEDGTWETLVRPGKRAKVGARFSFGGVLSAEVVAMGEEGNRIVRFAYDEARYGSIYTVLDEVGNMPLPPYITKRLEEKDRYQTVYAKTEGSAAAPTAGGKLTT